MLRDQAIETLTADFTGLAPGTSPTPNGSLLRRGFRQLARRAQTTVDVREAVNGLMLHAIVQPADIQDRDGGKLVLATMFGFHPFLRKLVADGGYQGPKFSAAQKKILPLLVTETVKRSDQAQGFEVIPRRWVVERTFAWPGRSRRLAKDFENPTRNALAFIRLASIRLMVRKLCLRG